MVIIIATFIVSFIVYSFLKLRSKKKRPNFSKIVAYTFVIVIILWILAFICSFFIGTGIGGEVAFVFIGIPILLVLLAILMA